MKRLKSALAILVLFSAPRVQGQGEGADIVFVYDNSASMWSHYAKIDANTGDTAFYFNYGCSNIGGDPAGTPFTYTTRLGPRTILLIDSAAICHTQAGDPYIARTLVISLAVDFLAARFPDATAGVISFGAFTDHAQAPIPLSVPGNAARVKDSLRLDSLPATHYVPPLRLAAAWLHDTSLTRNSRQAIIFISDGEPTDGLQLSTWLDVAKNTGIPIYSIALGDTSISAFARMQDLSLRTGGDYYSVSPRDVPRMNRVIEEIIVHVASVPVALRPARGPWAGSGASGSAVDAAGRRVPAAQAGAVGWTARPARRGPAAAGR